MKIDLARQVKVVRPRLKTVTIPEIKITRSQINDLAKLYLQVVKAWREGVKTLILPAYEAEIKRLEVSDGLTIDRIGTIRSRIEETDNFAIRAIAQFRNAFGAWMTRAQIRHLHEFISKLKYATNVDLTTQIGVGDAETTLEVILARNIALITDVSDQARGRISDAVYRGFQNRTPSRDVAKEIAEGLEMSRKRALNIAQDQAQKLSATLDKERQQQVGGTSFKWVHSGKKHYRPEHLARDGEIYAWDSEVGQNDAPGMAPFCGCKAAFVLNLEDL